ncbi:MAG: tail fiber domain-containing protein [Candidatus Udaeobacter sp.]
MKTPIPLVLSIFSLVCFDLLPNARAVTPAPDGGYSGANTAEGQNALQNLTSGVWNTALGYQSLFHDTTGNQNTATGYQALFNTTGSRNVADGAQALFSNTTGGFNTANGFRALYNNTTGGSNTAVGYNALYGNTTGDFNTVIGWMALNNTTGFYNTACGALALGRNAGAANTASGYAALYANRTGTDNTAYGASALANSSGGSNNIALGQLAGYEIYTGDNNIDIGNEGGNESNTIRIGDNQNAVYIAGIDSPILTGSPVYIDPTGRLGILSSSERFKDAIEPMHKASEAILALQPVTFHYKTDTTDTRQFGLIAEEVAKVNPDLVVRDRNGEIYTVRYEAVNAMLLNEFLKEHRKVEQQRKDFEAAIAQQQKQIDALTAGLQKVSAQLQASKPTPRVVANNH